MDACAVMVLYVLHADITIKGFNKISAHVELLVSYQAPRQVVDRGRLTRYGGYWGGPKPAPLPCGEGGTSKASGRNPDRKSACSEA